MSEDRYFIGTLGQVTPPADMMDAARRSLSVTGFSNLMERTGGRIPTPTEVVEFADAERLAGVEPPYSQRIAGEVAVSLADIGADVVGIAEPAAALT